MIDVQALRDAAPNPTDFYERTGFRTGDFIGAYEAWRDQVLLLLGGRDQARCDALRPVLAAIPLPRRGAIAP